MYSERFEKFLNLFFLVNFIYSSWRRLHLESPPIFLVENSISSKESVPVLREPRDYRERRRVLRKENKRKIKQQLIRRLGVSKVVRLRELGNKLAGQFECPFPL